jgi:hypothetical protein
MQPDDSCRRRVRRSAAQHTVTQNAECALFADWRDGPRAVRISQQGFRQKRYAAPEWLRAIRLRM